MCTKEATMNEETERVAAPGTVNYSACSTPDVTLDLGGIRCPMFGLKTMKALLKLEPGQTIELVTTNPSAKKAMERVSWMSGSRLIEVQEDKGRFTCRMRKE